MPTSLDIAICTSAWGEYGRYLLAWAESIKAQTLQPRQVVIVDAGITDTEPLNQALTLLPDVIYQQIPYTTLGDAKNTAVGLADTEWAIHLDADDTLLPWALADVNELHDSADVVSLGAIRDGKPQVFPGITAQQILHRKHGMFSCGAFRRSLWEQRPWHTHNNWVDSTFWVGLAHLGARFGSTGRVGFIYNQHDDSISHSLTPRERRAATKQWLKACEQWTLN